MRESPGTCAHEPPGDGDDAGEAQDGQASGRAHAPNPVRDLLDEGMARTGMTVRALADAVGVTTQYVYQWRNGERVPGLEVALRIATTLGQAHDRWRAAINKPQTDSIENVLDDVRLALYQLRDRPDMLAVRERLIRYITAGAYDVAMEEITRLVSTPDAPAADADESAAATETTTE